MHRLHRFADFWGNTKCMSGVGECTETTETNFHKMQSVKFYDWSLRLVILEKNSFNNTRRAVEKIYIVNVDGQSF